MNISSLKNVGVLSLFSSICFSVIVYLVLSYLLLSPKIAITLSIGVLAVIFGLSRFYSTSLGNKFRDSINSKVIGKNEKVKSDNQDNKTNEFTSSIIFVVFYGILIGICTLILKPDSHIFISWNHIGALGIIQLVASILLTFFVPGYAILLIISKKYQINFTLIVLLSYLISILISGGTEYASALYFDNPISETKNILIGLHLVILVGFIIFYPLNGIRNSYPIANRFVLHIKTKVWANMKSKGSELIVFVGLMMLLTVSSYYLFGGTTIGDQWYHQGRAFLFMQGSIREAALTSADQFYAPFQSAVLASIAALSGVPLVNTYASIAFVNITQILGFYYFFSTWMPQNMQRANILASTLFALSSGFGWIYLLGLSTTTYLPVSQMSMLDTITSTEPFDVFQPPNFFLASHPDFSTGLIYIVIPAGLVLLGVLRAKLKSNVMFLFIVTSISILGILTHDEFYLFVIVASLLPIIFRINQGHYLYLGLFFAFLIVFLLDVTAPQNYYTSNEILGPPLLFINVLFTGITWTLYSIKQNLHRIRPIFNLNKFRSRQPKHRTLRSIRFRFVIKMLLVTLVVYVYSLSFIVLAQLSPQDIKNQSAGIVYSIPWFLYPMKFGITGLIGLAFVLSYLFKKFETDVFVFGIIIIIALFAGPYYDEHRFSKYIMIGMAGFASLLLYRILNFLSLKRKSVIKIALLGSVITVASLSSILYVGYNSLILQTQEFEHSLLSRRNFPTESEMILFQIVHDRMDLGLGNKYNILTFPKEYDYDRGLMTFFQAFSGLPPGKVFEKPITLNVTALDAFYYLLDNSDVRYIVIPKDSIAKNLGFTEPVRFALDHFRDTYEDNEFVVLDVPNLASPSRSYRTDTALVYDDNQKDRPLLNISDAKILQYDNKTFDFQGETNLIAIQKDNKTEEAILSAYNSTRGVTFWSKPIDNKSTINLIEVGFQIINENHDRKNDVGLKWKQGNKEYSVALSDSGLELSEKPNKTVASNKIIAQNNEIELKDRALHTLRVETLNNSLNIFLDDKLGIQRQQIPTSNTLQNISQVGISASDSIVEFDALKIGNISGQGIHDTGKYYDYYYPLSLLALSKGGYDIFMDEDSSAFSKKKLILSFDPQDWDDSTFNKFMNYVNKGGTLIVLDSNNFGGRFGELFSIQPNDTNREKFARITGYNDQLINISGIVNKIKMNSPSEVNVIAAYNDKVNKTVAPFAIEKNYSNGGKIILVNAKPYFQALYDSPKQYFSSLSNVSELLDLNQKSSPSDSLPTPPKRFVGQVSAAGNMSLNGSSLLMQDVPDKQNIHAGRILIYDNHSNQSRNYSSVIIKDLILEGLYEITINTKGTLTLPGMASQHEYVDLAVPSQFNLSVDLLPNSLSFAEIVTLNRTSVNNIEVNNNSRILFFNVTTDSKSKYIPLLMKNPEIKVNGSTGYKQSNLDQYLTNDDIPLDVEGQLVAKFGFLDNYHQRYDNGTTKIQHLTFLDSLQYNKTNDNVGIVLNLPGDISPNAKQYGPQIPLKDAILSSSNLILLLSISVVSIVGSWLMWPRIKFGTTRDNRNKLDKDRDGI